MTPGKTTEQPGFFRALRNQLIEYLRLMRFDRPIGIWLLLWPTLWGLWIAADGHPDEQIFLVFVLGTVVMRAAGCVMNDIADRQIDPHVARTRYRPLAAGTVSVAEAVVLFVVLMLIAFGLVLMLNRLTLLLALGGAAMTVGYPFLKRFVSIPQFVLGAAFAWGIPMAFAAQTGSVPRLAWLLWMAVLVWGVAYDTIYAMADREEDLRIGVKSTAILFGAADVFIVSLLMAVFLVALVLVGRDAGLGWWYLGSIVAAALLFVRQYLMIRLRYPKRCFAAFLQNRHVGATVFAGIALHYLFAQS